MITPSHAAPDNFYLMLAFLLIFPLLYIECRKAVKERHEEAPAWGTKASSQEEFHKRILIALKHDKELEQVMTRKIVFLIILGSVSLLFVIMYGLICAGII